MADAPHHAPGGDESLRALYDAVPSAEELDLAEHVGSGPAPEPTGTVAEADLFEPTDAVEPLESVDSAESAEDEVTPLTDGQARGVLEHLLGAEPIEDDPEE